MRPLRIVGACIFTTFVLSLTAGMSVAAAAEPELPEVGRCVRLSGHNGVYKYKNCVVQSEGAKGAFEWLPGPGANSKFTVEIGEVHLETVGQKRVNCAGSEMTGEWTGTKTASLKVDFKACSSAERSCQTSPAAQAEIVTEQPFEGELGFIQQGEKTKVGLDLKPKSPSTQLLTFTCGGPPELTTPEPWLVEGSVIGQYRRIDQMKTVFGLLYQASGGKQIPQKFEAGLTDVPSVTRLVGAELLTEEGGLTLSGTEKKWTEGEYEAEPLEIKAKV